MPAANSTTTMTAAMVPHGVGRLVTTEDRVLRAVLLFLPLTIDRPDPRARHPARPRLLRGSSLGAQDKGKLSSTPYTLPCRSAGQRSTREINRRMARISPVSPALLDDLVRSAASEVLAARGLDPAAQPADAGIGRPRDPEQGEYATTVALRAAVAAGMTPLELAGRLAETLARRPEVAATAVAGPGFVNLWLTAAGRATVVAEVVEGASPVGDVGRMRSAAADVRVPDDLVAALGRDVA